MEFAFLLLEFLKEHGIKAHIQRCIRIPRNILKFKNAPLRSEEDIPYRIWTWSPDTVEVTSVQIGLYHRLQIMMHPSTQDIIIRKGLRLQRIIGNISEPDILDHILYTVRHEVPSTHSSFIN